MPTYKPTPKQVGRVASRQLKGSVRPLPRIQAGPKQVSWGGRLFERPNKLLSFMRQKQPGLNAQRFWRLHPDAARRLGVVGPTPAQAASLAPGVLDGTPNPAALPASQTPPVAPPLPAPPPPGQGGGPLQWNPQLPQHPLGQYTDAQYEADEAGLKSEFNQKYQDILQQIGFSNEQGQFIPGSLELEANQRRADINRDLGLAREESTNVSREQGTLFSGVRGTQLARAEHPYVSELSDIDIELPKQQAELYNQALGAIGDYGIGQYQNVLDYITRFKPSDKGGWEQPPVPKATTPPAKPPPKKVARKPKKVPYRKKGKKPSPKHLTG
jgi:hypothetical protein